MWTAIRFALLAAVLAFAAPVQAQTPSADAWISPTGNDANQTNGCVWTAPCQSFEAALVAVLPGGTISCTGPTFTGDSLTISKSVTIDCPGGVVLANAITSAPAIAIGTAGVEVILRGLVFQSVAFSTPPPLGIDITAAAQVRVENCKIVGFTQAGIKVEPSANSLTLKIQDSTISTNSTGILVAPTASAGVSVSIDRSRIENNSGGGVKIDTSSGPISASISDSSVSFNGGNGLNAVSIASAQSMLTLVRDVITKNAAVGIQANGANAAALVNNTVLDSNATGATSVVNGGRILTYGNNSVIGSQGSGFTGSTSLQ
jgi:hypothetical protein